MLVNLLSNAIKFSPKESIVRVDSKTVDPNQVQIRISDQGEGIPPEWADKIFDKFSQIEGRKRNLRVGSGLGLTFCRLAVEAQGGTIQVDQHVAQGTTILVTLPPE
jgi:signal transduction histidine kinase